MAIIIDVTPYTGVWSACWETPKGIFKYFGYTKNLPRSAAQLRNRLNYSISENGDNLVSRKLWSAYIHYGEPKFGMEVEGEFGELEVIEKMLGIIQSYPTELVLNSPVYIFKMKKKIGHAKRFDTLKEKSD